MYVNDKIAKGQINHSMFFLFQAAFPGKTTVGTTVGAATLNFMKSAMR